LRVTREPANARRLLSADAVRDASRRMLALARDNGLEDWQIDLKELEPTADFVIDVIRQRYPSLKIPFHARWRHFEFGGRDQWHELDAAQSWPDPASRARAAFDLAIMSVLLDAGAGPTWSFRDEQTGLKASRSEGLALASLRWFSNGGLSSDPSAPLRADAAALQNVDAASLGRAFQVSESNPLAGAEGRAQLLNRLGHALQARPDLFSLADSPRPGGLFDALSRRAVNSRLPASAILDALLEGFGAIWQNRPILGAIPLGDCWPHPALQGSSATDSFVPLHKLSQWLAYSLIEPLQQASIVVTDIDGLTGLAEYRNGGLFVDRGVLVPRRQEDWSREHAVSDPFVVGWRSLTVALLDELAPIIRKRLEMTAEEFPLACMLEGGTWAAGRLIARERRADGGPPFRISSDGTVF
jgi:Protein of unknown function (DUF1688)